VVRDALAEGYVTNVSQPGLCFTGKCRRSSACDAETMTLLENSGEDPGLLVPTGRPSLKDQYG